MIKTFNCKDTQNIFLRLKMSKKYESFAKIALRKLNMIHASSRLEDLKLPPANRLEKLKGNREGQCSIRINDQWRICFTWQGQDAFNVEIVDYH
jgi:toxin HigB-1